MKILLSIISVLITLNVSGQNHRDRIITNQDSIGKEVLFLEYVQHISELQGCYKINVICDHYNGKAIVYSEDLYNYYKKFYLTKEEKNFFNMNDYYIFAYNLLLGDTLVIEKKNSSIFNNRTFTKIFKTGTSIHYSLQKKQEFIASVIDTNGFLKKEVDKEFINYEIKEIISNLFDLNIYLNYTEEHNSYFLFDYKTYFSEVSDDLSHLVNKSLFQFIDSLNMSSLDKKILIKTGDFYPRFEINKCELIKRKIKTIDQYQINDYIKAFGNNYLILDLGTIQLNGNKIVLKFYLSEMLENPYRKGSYRQMTLKTEEFIYKINDNNHWEQVND